MSLVKCAYWTGLPILEMWHVPEDKGSLVILQYVFQIQIRLPLFLDIRNRVVFPSNSVGREQLEGNDEILND